MKRLWAAAAFLAVLLGGIGARKKKILFYIEK